MISVTNHYNSNFKLVKYELHHFCMYKIGYYRLNIQFKKSLKMSDVGFYHWKNIL